MTEDTPNYPNSARFWRLNEIAALTMQTECPTFCPSLAVDPADYAFILESRRRLTELTAQENRIKARYRRLYERENHL